MQKNQLMQLLLDRQTELEIRRSEIHADFTSRHISKNFSQQCKERENDDVLASLDHDAVEELEKIKVALKRLAGDDFQRCQDCGENISDERLQAIPYTTICRNCASSRKPSVQMSP